MAGSNSTRSKVIDDSICNMEAMVQTFLTEHNLSFSISSNIFGLAKVLNSDKMTLRKLRLAGTIVLYKMTYRLTKAFKEGLFKNVIKSPFSLNIIEETSINLHEI